MTTHAHFPHLPQGVALPLPADSRVMFGAEPVGQGFHVDKFTRAAELARTVLLRNPRDVMARAQLGYVQVAMGNREAGLDNALQAAKLDPAHYAVLFYVAMTMETLGKRELALPLLRGATKQQLKDLGRQPDLRALVNDEKFKELFEGAK